MKSKLSIKSTIVFLLLIIPQIGFSLDASVSLSRFRVDGQIYAEVYTQLIGQSVVFQITADSTNYQAKAEIIIRVESQNEIFSFEKKELLSPKTTTVVDFVDLTRISLPNTDATIIVEIADLNQAGNVFEFRKDVLAYDFNTKSNQSDIQLLASCTNEGPNSLITKQGFEFEALPYDLYLDKYSQLIYYAELYDLDQLIEKDFYISTIIYRGYQGEGGEAVLKKHKLYDAEAVNVVLFHMDISKLTSGNYHVVSEVHKRDKTLISSKGKNFQRRNLAEDERILKRYNQEFEFSFAQKLPAADLDAYLKMHRPKVESEWARILSDLLEEGDELSKRHFIYTLWKDEAPDKPETAFLHYMNMVENASKMFYNNVGEGYDTDRGYIYLKYGIPDDVLTVEDEPSAPPYEIWRYDQLETTGQTNVKFLFYNPSLAHNDFHLLHSTCRGELENPRWEVVLYKNAPGERASDTEMKDNFGRNARRNFHDF